MRGAEHLNDHGFVRTNLFSHIDRFQLKDAKAVRRTFNITRPKDLIAVSTFNLTIVKIYLLIHCKMKVHFRNGKKFKYRDNESKLVI